jgi:hypothetical protein
MRQAIGKRHQAATTANSNDRLTQRRQAAETATSENPSTTNGHDTT